MIRNFLQEKTGYKVWWNGGERGDYSMNVGNSENAERTKKELSGLECISKIETVNGFVNFWLSEEGLREGLANTRDSGYLRSLGKNKKVQVEFISANPTGHLTLGNGRGGVYGDVLANVFKMAGYDAMKEYYVNDMGNQIEILGHSVLKDGKAEYRGDYIDELTKKIKEKDPKIVGEKAAGIILKSIKKTVFDAGIKFDVWFSEKKDLRKKGKVEEIINWLKEKGLTYEKDNALWFKAKDFGDSEDRVLIKTNGEPTYFCVDCAYHKNKFVERKFDKVINIWGADHHGDAARVKGFVKTLGFENKLEIILMQHVRLIKDKKPARMSKREGTYILIDDVLKEVGKDVFRYFMLTRSPDTHMDFDMDLAKEQSKKNPVYYIQYAGARTSSILRKANFHPNSIFQFFIPFLPFLRKVRSAPTPRIEKLSLGSKEERALILKLIQFPEVIEDIVQDYQVHRLTTYIYELAKTFTDFYENVRVLDAESDELKKQRLNLVFITRQILEQTLNLLGISAPEKM